MATETITDTERVLADLLTENTGAALCDSGGAYGRNWERNQGRTVEDWLAEDEATLTDFGPRFSAFHYLRYKLDYAPDVDAVFQGFVDAPARKDASYFECVYEWCAEYDRGHPPSFLTYNMDECLSQGFQADTFEYKGESYCCLSIHGGCDVRGGYTRPRVFRIVSDMFGFDLDSYTLHSEDRKGDSVVVAVGNGELVEPESGSYISRDDPLARWASFWHRTGEEGYPEWDRESGRWKAPDGDGYIGIEPDFLYNS